MVSIIRLFPCDSKRKLQIFSSHYYDHGPRYTSADRDCILTDILVKEADGCVQTARSVGTALAPGGVISTIMVTSEYLPVELLL